ncbi:MAG: protein kinase [Nannocystaceae bacterium]|nr:protein kinase [Nannocystaceae bacterium]
MSDESRPEPTVVLADTVALEGDDAADTAQLEGAALATEARDALARAQESGGDTAPETLGRFRIVERIGRGGMGVVYLAHDDELDRDVAIKLLRADLAPDLSRRERLLREAQAIARLSHPNIVHVYEVGHSGRHVFMAMELIRGETLRRYCKGKGWREIVDACIGAGEGLAAAHAHGVVHRDFKPDNVLIDEQGRARVVDFGLARAPGTSGGGEALSGDRPDPLLATPPSGGRARLLDLTGAGTVLGTPAYMAPEQLAKSEPDTRTDQFAYCVTLFEMLYDRRPFAGSTYTELVRAIVTGLRVEADAGPLGVPRSVRRILLRGLSRAPEDRYASMDELLAALRRARAPGSRRGLVYAGLGAAAAAAIVQLARPPAPTPVVPEAPSAPLPEPTPIDPWREIVAHTADLPPPLASPLPGDPTGVTVHRLRNGLTVYVAHRPLEPEVAVTLAVRAGSDQERGYGPGLGYLVMMSLYRGGERLGAVDPAMARPSLALEHALLRALPQAPDDAARDAMIAAASATEHAAAPFLAPTDLDDAATAIAGEGLSSSRSGSGTTFTLELPPHRLDAWLAILAETVRHPAFRDTFAVVQSQLDLYASTTSNDRAWQLLQRELAAATGLREDYETATQYLLGFPLDDAMRFHDSFYRPNNLAIVLVGDLTPEQALPLCEKHFGDWAPAPIPAQPPVDAPLPEGVVRREIEDGGAPAVFMSWPLPPTQSPEYGDFVTLASALGDHDGLASGLRRDTAEVSWSVTPYRTLDVRATALGERSLADTEAATMAALESIAGDALPDEAWAPALARAELEQLGWARSSGALASTIAGSFIDRRSWQVVANALTVKPSRAAMVATARRLVDRSRAVVYKHPGETWHVPMPNLPGTRLPTRYGRRSAFARAIVDAPVTPPEPRFLLAGSHYQESQRGNRRVITTDAPGPLAMASWVYPVGVDQDPFVCDAVRARMRAVAIPGIDFGTYCANDFVWIDVVAPADRFVRDAPLVFDWLERGMPSEQDLEEYLARALQTRAARRLSDAWREPSFHAWALRGDAGIDAHMPDDATLRERGATALPASLRRLGRHAADLLYIGPDAARVRELVPPSSGTASTSIPVPRTRALRRDLVFVLHDPARDGVEVRAAVPWPELEPRLQLAAQLHVDQVIDGLQNGPPHLEPRWATTPWWAARHPLATQATYAAREQDVLSAAEAAIALVRMRVPAAEFDAARRRLEVSFRAWRTPTRAVPEAVRFWPEPGTDPRLAQWLALPGLSYADLERYESALGEAPLVLSIIGNADRMDLDALAQLGELRRIDLADLEDLLRDANASDT